MTERIDPRAPPDAASAALAACPQLVSVDGPWHAAGASRAHRCRLLVEGRPTLERQRAHCLVAEHVECPTWLDAQATSKPPDRPGPFVGIGTVVMEGPGLGNPAQGVARRAAGPVTVVVVALALGAFVLARGPLAPGFSGAGDDGPASPPASAVPASTAPSPPPTATPAPTARPTPTAAPTASPRPQTYKVRRNDTLSSIAAKFGTTVAALKALNNIQNASLIRTGQVLQLP